MIAGSRFDQRTQMKINVDTDRCTGHGVCESIEPEVFEVGDDGVVHLLTTDLTEAMRPNLESAVAECPTQALSLEG
jgi:ferredoxin